MPRGELRTVRVGEFDFEVRVHPGGPVNGAEALLLHGFPQSAASWDGVAEHSSQGVRSYAPEQRGYSPGARPVDVASYRLSELRADIVGLCDALGLRRIHLVGHDWGAIVAWDVAARYPDRVATLTAVSVPHPAAFARAREIDPVQAEKSEYMAFFQQPGAPEELLLANDCAGLRAGFGDTVPAEQSARSGVDATSEYVDAEYRLLVMEGVGHWIPEEAPESLSRVVLDRIGLR
ncbi:alpha/beta fold hydrolase [Nocardia flavorosea]|uniref:alpha/beta fold hydrolase n=1 Tax=Nocardia flavorosea TaxID=53429 RepID=UPI001894784B|nr:alpha/beta fold hydrolase [Nocardia flavorosea]MBF6347809.1 alpha/beta fold hydrolase [Nocardia flavorosea]